MTYETYKIHSNRLSQLLQVKHQRGYNTPQEEQELKNIVKLIKPFA